MKSIYYDPNLQEKQCSRRWFKNVKLIGEIDEGTSIYIEDYAYTYLNQLAGSDLSRELCAVLIGEHHKESQQVIVSGAIVVDSKLRGQDIQWIEERDLDVIEDKRKCYFPEGEYVGWMHTQPGYGIMATIKETAVHKEIFGQDCILMLMDPIYDTEAFFTYKKDGFEEKKGFCMYYEKNEPMQKYMEDHSFLEKKEQVEKEKIVDDFRELGARWKKEVERKKRRNRVIGMTVAGTALTLAIIGIYGQQKRIHKLQKEVVNIQEQYSQIESRIPNNPVELVFTPNGDNLNVESEVEKALELETESTLEMQPRVAYDIHSVEMGDSLLSISYNYYKTVGMAKEIANLNSIENEDTIYIGQKLKLPKRVQ